MNPLFTRCAAWIASAAFAASVAFCDPPPKPEPDSGPPRYSLHLLAVVAGYEAHTFTLPGSKDKLPYRLLKPIQAGKVDRKFPLIFFLHASGDRGDDNIRQLRYGGKFFLGVRTRYAAYVVFPQCQEEDSWSDASWSSPRPGKMPEKPTRSMEMLMQLVDELARKPDVDTHRIYIMGISMGGFGVWDILAREPDRFAAAMPMCGGGDPGTVSRIASVPLWVFHGAVDSKVPVVRAQMMVEALKKAGAHPRYSEYPGVDHDSWEKAFLEPDFFDWLFAQRK